MLSKSDTIFRRWLRHAGEDHQLLRELQSLIGNDNEIAERFSSELVFGTGGLRALMGAGSARLNLFTIRKITQGLANVLNKRGAPGGVAIAYDSRIDSERFAKETACVLAANGITAYIFPKLMPTPALSFAIRRLHCDAGIMITASHNSKEYNGYKVYGADGGQLTPNHADEIETAIHVTDPFMAIARIDFSQGVCDDRIRLIGEETKEDYLQAVSVLGLAPAMQSSPLKIVYTPLHGAGLDCVTEILARNGFEHVTVVPEQREPNGQFPTCPAPNPERSEALSLGVSLCQKIGADLLIATDPDCDRIGLVAIDNGRPMFLSGDEMGALMLEYLCARHTENGTMPNGAVAVSTIVSTPMASMIAARYGVEMRTVLTGFKYIGEQIGLLERQGSPERFIFGFEESFGVLTGTHVRDKDAVNGALTAAQMAEYYRQKGMTLGEAVQALYDTYGYYLNKTCDFVFPGLSGVQEMKNVMEHLRTIPFTEFADQSVVSMADYQSGIVQYMDGRMENITLPTANVIQFSLSDRTRVTVRPSGTEPKLKLYYAVYGKTQIEANRQLQCCRTAGQTLIEVIHSGS